MKITLTCPTCTLSSSRRFYQSATLVDEGAYEVVCPMGHRNWVALQQLKFELLYEAGVSAIVDGYYREAVSSFAAALERFFEFYVRVHCEGTGVGQSSAFDKVWKGVASQSERQLGAFMFVYLLKNGAPAPMLAGKQVEFRNAVIHKGRFPTVDEAVDYGDAVANLIQPVLLDLKTNHMPAVQAQIAAHLARASARITLSGGVPRNTLSWWTMINIALGVTEPIPDLRSYLDRARTRS
jgi:hypothetical protein